MSLEPLPRPDQQSEALLAQAADVGLPARTRIAAASALVRMGLFAEVESELSVLSKLPEIAQEARRLIAVCHQFKRWGIVNALEDYTNEKIAFERNTVLVARRPGAKKVIFVFTGNAKQVWVSIHIFNQLLPKDCHIVYLRDPHGAGFLFGLDALGLGYAQTLAGLRTLQADLGQPAIYCIGSSQGGYAALRYGLDLRARQVLAIAGRTDLSALPSFLDECELKPELRRKLVPADQPSRYLPAGDLNLANLYKASDYRPNVVFAFGGAHPLDASEARKMDGIPEVMFYEIPSYSEHDVLAELFATGQIRDLIAWLTVK